MYGAGFYSYSIFALIFWETRRSDFGISMTHHVVSLSLIVLSYIFRYNFIFLISLPEGHLSWFCEHIMDLMPALTLFYLNFFYQIKKFIKTKKRKVTRLGGHTA